VAEECESPSAAVVADGLLDPSIDPTLKVAIIGVVNAVLAGLGAWIGKPGDVVVAQHTVDLTPALPHEGVV
jgi:putative Mn2+ efflux pump MntP